MNCEKCKTRLPYGAAYCGICGEKAPEGAYEDEYNDTIWSKIDSAKDRYDYFFLKKITGSMIFKILSMAVVLAYFLFTMYGNFMGIRLNESENYEIQYNKTAEEYYIYPKNELSNLDLYVPIGTDGITFTEVNGDNNDVKNYTLEEYREKGYLVVAGENECIYIETTRKGKITDRIKLVAIGR